MTVTTGEASASTAHVSEVSTVAWFRRWSASYSVISLLVVYLGWGLVYSLRTRAWESYDEQAHAQYVEFIVRHHAIPHIGLANGIESHQPPLYYLLAAAWQKLLGISPFSNEARPSGAVSFNHLVHAHNYTAIEHTAAVSLHEVRLLSVLLGIVTVLSAYGAGRAMRLPEYLSIAIGMFVALLPKLLVTSSTVTNDALVVPLCGLALYLFLKGERFLSDDEPTKRRLLVLAMGITLGAAALTKFNSLPVAGVLFLMVLIPVFLDTRRRAGSPRSASPRIRFSPQLLLDAALAAMGFFLVSGWWFVRNKHLYGQFLATEKSQDYLRAVYLHPVPWNLHLVFSTVPHNLETSVWYGQPALGIPHWANYVLDAVAIASVVVGAVSVIAVPRWLRSVSVNQGWGLIAVTLAGLLACAAVAQSASFTDGRVLLVAVSAIGCLGVLGVVGVFASVTDGLRFVGAAVWPLLFLLVDVYVLTKFLIPLGGL